MKIKNSPYNLRETLGYFKRNTFGPVSKNQGLVTYAPKSFELNPGINAKVKVGFIGDIMDMAGHDLSMGACVKEFFQDCDYLVGNFEATLTTAKGAYMAQRHKPQILDALADLFDPRKTCLSLANNHSGDFGYDVWAESKNQVEERGFQLFGTAETPFVEMGEDLRLTGCTWWTNQPCDYIAMSNRVSDHVGPGRFNILYPHWGYELELYPRPVTVHAGTQWFASFDAIIGHHSHTPQPIVVEKTNGQDSVRRLVAYGLGDFCICEKLAHYRYGQLLKTEIGHAADGARKIGKVDWQFSTCRQKSETEWVTEIVDVFPYLK
jgi:poly-gamma-glutamate capsule biosynthesis protein CapA/YwtB (metallophosphatase superfamily)